MPYLLQLVSPNDSAKVRKIFRPANFLHSGSYWDIRDNVNQGPSKFPRMPASATHRTARDTFNLFRILSFRLLSIRRPFRLADVFCLRNVSISADSRPDNFDGHTKSSNHPIENSHAGYYHSVFDARYI